MGDRDRCVSRSRAQVITGDEVADEYGVNKSSYDPVVLPNIKAYRVTCTSLGAPSEVLDIATEAIPKELEWGEVRACVGTSRRTCDSV